MTQLWPQEPEHALRLLSYCLLPNTFVIDPANLYCIRVGGTKTTGAQQEIYDVVSETRKNTDCAQSEA